MGKIAWCITGAGHLLKESVEVMARLESVDLFVSDAGVEILALYKVRPPVNRVKDRTASTVACRGFYSGVYDLLVIAPATSNSVAKFVSGISDNLITTLFAQAGKAEVPVVVLPTDVEEYLDTMGVTKPLKVRPRPIDMENVKKLSDFPGVKVVKTAEELTKALSPFIKGL